MEQAVTVVTSVEREPLPDRRKGLVEAPYGNGLATLALGVGGLAIGTGEFAAMGILPGVAADLGISIPQAGHMISAYALGVVVGAPLIAALSARIERRRLLIGLMLFFGLANLLGGVVSSHGGALLARFLAGMPHGAYFGIAALMAASMVPANRRGQAIGRVMLGLSIANIVGVPLATWLGQALGWRATFVAVALVGFLTASLCSFLVPQVRAAKGASLFTELDAFRRVQVWLTVLGVSIGFAGMFALYSYLVPTLVDVTGVPLAITPVMLGLFGLGMVLGNVIGGRLTDWSVRRSIIGLLLYTAVVLALFVAAAHSVVAIVPVLVCVGFGTAIGTAFQARFMDVAGDAQLLAASLNHSAFNIANALGAWLGGMTVALGFGWTSVGWVGAALALGGAVVMTISFGLERRGVA